MLMVRMVVVTMIVVIVVVPVPVAPKGMGAEVVHIGRVVLAVHVPCPLDDEQPEAKGQLKGVSRGRRLNLRASVLTEGDDGFWVVHPGNANLLVGLTEFLRKRANQEIGVPRGGDSSIYPHDLS
jgi:hypothetical protein